LLRGSPDRNIESNLLDKTVPTFELPLYESFWAEYGESFDSSSYTDKPKIINFWATWCPPCIEEAPEFQAAWEAMQNDVLFVGIQTQDRGKFEQGQAFIDRFGISFPIVMDDNSKTSIEFGLFGVPETFFVRADGTLAYRHTGAVTASFLQAKAEEVF